MTTNENNLEKEFATYGWMKIHCCDNCRFGEHDYEGVVNCANQELCKKALASMGEDDVMIPDCWIYDCDGIKQKGYVDDYEPGHLYVMSWGSNHCRFWEWKDPDEEKRKKQRDSIKDVLLIALERE